MRRMLTLKLLAGLPAVGVMGALTNTISLGSVIVGGLVAVGTLVTLMFGVKYRVLADQQALAISTLVVDRDTWKDLATTRLETIDQMATAKAVALDTLNTVKEEKARLEALPDLTQILDHMAEDAKRRDAEAHDGVREIVSAFTDAMEASEGRAAARWTEITTELKTIAAALKPTDASS